MVTIENVEVWGCEMKYTRKARASRIVSSCFVEARKAGINSLWKALKTYGCNNWRKFHHLPMRRGYKIVWGYVEEEDSHD